MYKIFNQIHSPIDYKKGPEKERLIFERLLLAIQDATDMKPITHIKYRQAIVYDKNKEMCLTVKFRDSDIIISVYIDTFDKIMQIPLPKYESDIEYFSHIKTTITSDSGVVNVTMLDANNSPLLYIPEIKDYAFRECAQKRGILDWLKEYKIYKGRW